MRRIHLPSFFVLLAMTASSPVFAQPADLNAESQRLRAENAQLRAQLQSAQAEIARLSAQLRQVTAAEGTGVAGGATATGGSAHQGVAAAGDSGQVINQRVAVPTINVALKRSYDDARDVTTIYSDYARLAPGSILKSKQWGRLAYAYRGKQPTAPPTQATLTIYMERTNGALAGVKQVRWQVDGEELAAPVTDREVDRQSSTRGKVRITTRDETLTVTLPMDLVRQVAAAKAPVMVLGPEDYPLPAELRAIFAAVAAQVR